eukprot:330725-Rhodomonas_salina.1
MPLTLAKPLATAALPSAHSAPVAHAAAVEQLPKCSDTIENHADPVLKDNYRHLIMFDGEVDEELLLLYVRNIKQSLVTPASAESKMIYLSFQQKTKRNTICNSLDTMNTMLLRAGKPRIHVRGIAQQGKVDYDLFGKPKYDNDPDAMLVLFCEKLVNQDPVQLGKQVDLNENLEFQRAWRKAEQARCKRLFDKQREQLESTIQTGLQERAELGAENCKLKAEAVEKGAVAEQAASAGEKFKDEIKALQADLETLKAENIVLKATNTKLEELKTAASEAAVEIGVKRQRGSEAHDLLMEKLQQSLEQQ